MPLAVKILDKVINRIQNVKEKSYGFLFGINNIQEQTLWIVGPQLQLGKTLVNSYPAGINLCGQFQTVEDKEHTLSSDQNEDSNYVIITYSVGAKESLNVFLSKFEKLEKISYEVVTENELYSRFIFIQSKGGIPIKCSYEKQAIQDFFLNLKRDLINTKSVAFNLTNSAVYLFDKKVIGIEVNSKIEDIYNEQNQNEEISYKKKKNQINLLKYLEMDILWRKTKNDKESNEEKHAPVCILNKSASTIIDTMANVDSLAIIPVYQETYQLYDVLLKAVCRYLNLFEENLLEFISTKKTENQSLNFQTFHFSPTECGFFLTVLYPEHKTEDALRPHRQLLHKQLLLDEVSPRFRRANQYSFDTNMKQNSILINPHEGLKATDNGGDIITVKGKYEYFHYCQNNIDDNGWGCAYRSLQTLASWFKLQGYINTTVPSILDIQKCLVDIKDKPASFVGSRQWIGSTEVNFVLNTLLGVDSKILHVSSGEEMSTKGPELFNHFAKQGSPVMIGGGVLAHTVLGVDYNRTNGSLKFLILDPHYTGSEDLHIIQSKGWCGWKGVEFWNKTSYYNMCLPQVPKDI